MIDFLFCFCGKSGIRTLGTRESSSVFETDPIDHSGNFPVLFIREYKNTFFFEFRFLFC